MHVDGTLSATSHDSGIVVASLPMRAPTKPQFARELPPGPLRDTRASDHRRPCAAAARASAQPRARTVGARRRAQDGRPPTLEETTLVGSNGADAPLRPRLRMTGIRGYDKELSRVQEALVVELGFKPADQPLVDEAVRAAGGVPGGLPTKVGVPLTSDMRSDSGRCGRAPRDARGDRGEPRRHDRRHRHRVPARPAGVGTTVALGSARAQARVPAGPSSRTTGRSSAGCSRRPATSATSTCTCSSSTRCARSFRQAMRDDLDPLLRVLRARRATARRAMVRALRSKRTSTLLADWGSFLDGLEGMPSRRAPGRDPADRRGLWRANPQRSTGGC